MEGRKVRTVLVIDQSESMLENGKWSAILDGLRTIAAENAGLSSTPFLGHSFRVS